jgi:predicted SprT family Zn-dependent metalloprotease
LIKPNDLDAILANIINEADSVCEGDMTRLIQHINSGVPICLVSADRYNYTRKQKEQARKQLRVDINKAGLSYTTLQGNWNSNGNVSNEISFFVIGMRSNDYVLTNEEMKQIGITWCKKYKQECVIVGSAEKKYAGELEKNYTNTNKIKFELLSPDGDVWNTFTAIKFGSPESIKKLHEKYIDYREKHEKDFNREKDDPGFGGTQKHKNVNNEYALLNPDENSINKGELESDLYVGNKLMADDSVVSSEINSDDMDKLNDLFKKCKKIFDEMGFPTDQITGLKFNNRVSNAIALCRLVNRRGPGLKSFNIEFSSKMFHSLSEEGLINTMLHEMVHSLPGGFSHGAKFHDYARMLNDKYGVNVETYYKHKYDINTDEIMDNFKYVLRCQKCGATFGKSRFSDMIVHPNNYRHSGCGGIMELIKGGENLASAKGKLPMNKVDEEFKTQLYDQLNRMKGLAKDSIDQAKKRYDYEEN